MSKKDEALKLALEALTHLQPTALTSFYTIGNRDKAITAIREALAAVPEAHKQPAQHERVQPDSECKEDDGCPTEKAVLQRFWRKAQKQEPVALDVTVEGDSAKLLASMLEPVLDDEPTPIRLLVGNGHSGHGLYVAAAEYQEEGAALLVNTSPPAQRIKE